MRTNFCRGVRCRLRASRGERTPRELRGLVARKVLARPEPPMNEARARVVHAGAARRVRWPLDRIAAVADAPEDLDGARLPHPVALHVASADLARGSFGAVPRHVCPALSAFSLVDTIAVARTIDAAQRSGCSVLTLAWSAPLPEAILASYLVWVGAPTRHALSAMMRHVPADPRRDASEALVRALGRHLGR